MKEVTTSILAIMEVSMEPRSIRKHAFLLKAGQTARDLFFIRKGLIRCYYKLSYQEISACFMKENDWLLSIESFYEQMPS